MTQSISQEEVMPELNHQKLQHLQDLEEIKALKNKYAYGANIINGNLPCTTCSIP